MSNSNHTSGKFYSYKSEQFKEIRSDFLDWWPVPKIWFWVFFFVWFDTLRPINNLSVIRDLSLGWTSIKLRLMFLLKDAMQWRQWGSNLRTLSLKSRTLPLSHCPEYKVSVFQKRSKIWIFDNQLSRLKCRIIALLLRSVRSKESKEEES